MISVLIARRGSPPYRLRQWTEKDKEIYFNPDFMRRVWFPVPMKTLATIRVPEDFFLRPHLSPEKFPEDRKLIIAPEVEARSQGTR